LGRDGVVAVPRQWRRPIGWSVVRALRPAAAVAAEGRREREEPSVVGHVDTERLGPACVLQGKAPSNQHPARYMI
jgi:hypothetical protein